MTRCNLGVSIKRNMQSRRCFTQHTVPTLLPRRDLACLVTMKHKFNYYEILVGITLICAINPNPHWLVLCQQDASLDQILKDLSILTRQQLESSQGQTPHQNASPKAESYSGLTASSIKAKLDSPLINSKQFTLPANYDPNKPPRLSKVKPLVINVNMTVLHAAHDKQENLITLDLEMKECWRDKRLRIRQTPESGKENDDEDEDDDDLMLGQRRLESFMLEAEWASRLWHPVGRVQGSAEVRTTLAGRASVPKPKNLEQEALIESIYIVANVSTAYVWMSLKLRITIPAYECMRDDSTLYPFDKIKCSFNIVNVLLDKRSLIYKWESIKWQPSGYQTGEFYLRDLSQSVTSQSVTDIDRSSRSSEHSSLQVEFLLKRHIGDYVLNVYVLHIFLLALCVASFWISITNVVIRMSLSIIILIIIKFQTIQTLKTEHHIVSALSVWTFGLSCLVILSLLCHILSYYSVQHKWNDKVLSRLVKRHQETGRRDSSESDLEMNGTVGGTGRSSDSNSYNQNEHASPFTSVTAANLTGTNSTRDQWRIRLSKIKQNCLLRLNSIILNNTKSVGYDKSNVVDIIARIALIFIYALFVVIYFSKYVL